jgi:hypothetical protein
MKTPYDTALRVQQREIDDMRVAINVQVNVLNQVERSREAVNEKIVSEAAIAASDIGMSSHAYIARMRAEQSRLSNDQAAISARLGQLRSKAVAAYGAFRAVETAADGFRDEAVRASANAEQAGMDDFAAVSFINARRSARRASPQ